MDTRQPTKMIVLRDLRYTLKMYALLHRQHIIDKICSARDKGFIDTRRMIQLLQKEIGRLNVRDAITMAQHMTIHNRE